MDLVKQDLSLRWLCGFRTRCGRKGVSWLVLGVVTELVVASAASGSLSAVSRLSLGSSLKALLCYVGMDETKAASII